MAKTKIRAKSKMKSPPWPAVQKQAEVPEKKAGPLPAASRPDLMMATEQNAGAAGRARMTTGMQQTVGNTRLNRLLGTTVQAKLAISAANDRYEREADQVASQVGRTSTNESNSPTEQSQPGTAVQRLQRQFKSTRDEEEPVAAQQGNSIQRRVNEESIATTMIQRQPAAPPAAAPAPAVTLTPLDQVVSASLLDTLDRFQNIPIDVPGVERLPAGVYGPPAPVTVRVQVHAQYFINRPAARAHYRNARRTERFSAIIRALARRGEMSLLEGARRRRTAGRAVELGKATPEDIKKFVEEALRQGIIRRYALRRRVIPRSQQLIDLTPVDLQALIQGWMQRTGVGVDCSGFVQQAAIRAGEAERSAIGMVNAITGFFGLPTTPLPPVISPVERSAASFSRGPRVRVPTDLRPGDAWVVRGGGHIRVVTAVREVTLQSGTTTIEFDTAESSGGSTRPEPGPVGRTWRTRSMTRFHRITAIGHTARPRGGTFHRIR
jgi:hypothetical protein